MYETLKQNNQQRDLQNMFAATSKQMETEDTLASVVQYVRSVLNMKLHNCLQRCIDLTTKT